MFNFTLNKLSEDDLYYNKLWDFVSLGAGPAGINASLYAKRKGLETLIVAKEIGGQLNNTEDVDNYLGFKMINANSLIDKFIAHIDSLNIEKLIGFDVISIIKDNEVFTIKLNNGKYIKAKTLLYALGGNPRKLQIEGEDKYSGKGVSYCVTCDGPFYKDKKVVVAGGGNSAVEAAIDLSKVAKEVYIIHRSQFRADKILLDRMFSNKNIKVYLETTIKKIVGNEKIEYLEIIDNKTLQSSKFYLDGLFVEIGNIPNSYLIEDIVKTNERKEIIVNEEQRTSVEGLFAAGDVTAEPEKQIIISAAAGAKAALAAAKYINKRGE
ncbi:MAG: FAD-dependent oxidoreductase [Bacilli bacterium]|jgi:thioredoxin-disulfide reductase|nr:FAD-dependent oxidoreductase [Bacilli bacterium]MDD2681866.1 FAD-dependent oxidoreductase [Bacilli bacterium]MDD3120793.1 FAD-dependent oxidoreductase [Bacilli bacterium]MDD4062988.1 FAD-dependent oxidoreductase [Bacilli bacterium]MDD4481732.1 FAD-dependent oxidoreductase [Bacilli bacterium]